MSETPEISANQLRALAERADSRRGETVFLVRTGNAKNPYDIANKEPENPADVVLRLNTSDADPQFKPRLKLKLTSDPVLELEAFPGEGIEKCDAIFLSLPAVEKFVIPYYQQFRSSADVKQMRDQFCLKPEALAVAHIPDSIETTLKVPTDGKNGGLFVLRPSDAKPGVLSVKSLELFARS